MPTPTSVIVRCGHLAELLYATIATVEAQQGVRPDIVIVTDRTTPAAAREWVSTFARARGLRHEHVDADTPGVIWNTGVRVTSGRYVHCLDSGDRLDPAFHTGACAILDRQADVSVVTSAVLVAGPGASQQVESPTELDLPALLANPDAIHTASIFRREAWTALGGFDEALPCLEAHEFWLRILAAGGTATCLDRSMLVRPLRRGGLFTRDWDGETRAAAIRAIARRHANLFGGDPATTLFARETRLRSLAPEYHGALSRRDDALAEIDRLKSLWNEIVSELPDGGRLVDFGDLRRTTPVSRHWGFDRGVPVDRHYIELFLERHAADVAGAVLEVLGSDYAARFGGDRVTQLEVLDLDAANPRASIVADLRCAPGIPADTFDCVILTQTLHLIDDMAAVVAECARILKPGGVLLATLPCASKVSLEYGPDGDFWRVTEAGARRVFSGAFPPSGVTVASHGNVLASAAFLYGIADNELDPTELDARDPYFPLLVTVRAQKPSIPAVGAVLIYHRVASVSTDPHRLAVPPDEFDRQMAFLRQSYTPMPLAEFAARASDGRLPRGAVAVTFDDGYLDNLETASPILVTHAIPATFFLTTERLEDPAYEYWWDVLARILLEPAAGLPDELQIPGPEGSRRWPTRTDSERTQAHADLYRLMASDSPEGRDALLRTLRQWSGLSSRDATARRMTRSELAELVDRPGHDIGAHTARHLMLPGQPPDALRAELEQSKADLERALGRTVHTFAYPFGAFDAAVRAAVDRAGFSVAVACDDRAIHAGADPLALPRLDPAARPPEDFAIWLRRHVQPTPRDRETG